MLENLIFRKYLNSFLDIIIIDSKKVENGENSE